MATPWYAYPITQAYGQNGEVGVDLGTPFHTPITALFAGTVRFAGRTQWKCGSSGGEITIVCNVPGLGLMTSYYLHLDVSLVNIGDTVNEGQVIGLSGGQLSGGQWPVVNCPPTIYSSGPHTEFGFNAYWVSGPGHNIDPTPYILAARNGTLPGTTPDGTSTGGSAPNYNVQTATAIEQSFILAYTTAANTKKIITQAEGFDGICKDLDYHEQFAAFNWLNPAGSIFANLAPFMIRAAFFIIGLAIFWIALRPMITGAAGGISDKALPIVSSGGGEASAAGALAEAPEIAAL